MSEREAATVVPDVELVADLRAGDRRPMAELYSRHHADAVRVGRIVHPDGDAEELAAEAFARVFTKILDGGGPTGQFRAYLHAVIRNLRVERVRHTSRERPASDKLWLFDTALEHDEAEVDGVEVDHAARALESLPENWQQLLWSLEVQGRKPAEVAAELSVPVATISDTVYRAREGLRLAYLNQHLAAADNSRCEWTRDRLGKLVRGKLSARASAKVRHHLSDCAECSAVYDELHQVNTKLGAMIWPIVLLGGISLDRTAGAGASDSSDTSGQHGGSTTSRVGRMSGSSSAAAGSLNVVAVVMAIALVAGIATTGVWLLQAGGDVSPAMGAAPAESVPTPAPPPPSVGPRPEIAEEPTSPDIENIAQVLAPGVELRDGGTPGRLVSARTDLGRGTLPGPKPSPAPVPDPEPTPEPPVETGPVDVGVGSPTIEPAGPPDQWVLTLPILTDGVSATGFTITLELVLDELAGFVERQSTGWDCGPIQDGDSNGDPYFFDSVTCEYTHEPGQAVDPLVLVLESLLGPPTGEVTISSDGNADPNSSNDTTTF